jgi:sugar lactone lactonase YvrE
MRNVRRGVGVVALLLTLAAPLHADPGHADDDHAHSPDTIALPNGWQPEGITTDGKHLYAGSLVDGAIWRADPRTGAGAVLAEGETGRVAVGIDYDRRRHLLWVAGGATGEIRAQDADTGETVATYLFQDKRRFLNDIVVTPRGVYATDSMNQELAVVPLTSRHGDHGCGLPPSSVAETLPLAGDLVYEAGFNLNGIVRSGSRLLAIQTNTGTLFRIDRRTGDTTAVDLGNVVLTWGDGLEPGHGVLYVVRNMDNVVSVLDLNRRLTRGRVVDEITDEDFDVPATAALVRHSLYAVNARFTTPPTPETEYSIVRVDAR